MLGSKGQRGEASGGGEKDGMGVAGDVRVVAEKHVGRH